MKSNSFKTTINCTTAEDFLSKLAPNSSHWNGDSWKWAYRGQANARWPLVPSAFRWDPDKKPKLHFSNDPILSRQPRTNRTQVEAEIERWREFVLVTDRYGQLLPEDNQKFRTPEGWKEFDRNLAKKAWPIPDVLSTLALAQHYGVATRLLDWSEKAYVGAYFAAERALLGAPDAKRKRLSVWCLDVDWVIWTAWPSRLRRPIELLVVTAPRATNPNLHAQHGLFIAPTVQPSDFNKSAVRIPMEKIIENAWNKYPSIRIGRPVLQKITLPVTEAGKLLRLLHAEGVSGPSIYPGFRGASRWFDEREVWDVRPRTSFWVNGRHSQHRE